MKSIVQSEKHMPKTKAPSGAESKQLREPKGMHDILPADQPYWEKIEKAMKDLAEFYNFKKIETPVLEYASLYEKGTGEETDIVQKEMYVLKTKGGDTLALRPEYTPAIMRSYAEYSLGRMGQPQKLYYFGPVFRHDAPQAGRYRQFSQIGFEVIGGPNDPLYDAQIITIFQHVLEALKVKGMDLRINSIGCRVCRPLYKKQIQNYYRAHEKKICADCQRRFKTSPLRLLDCKNAQCQEFKEKAPNILDKLCNACSNHLKSVLEYLDEVGISYRLDPHLVRGLDYYSRTVFEFGIEGKGSEFGSVCGGGRYDYLMETLGGRPTPAVGWAAGVERIIEVLKAQEVKILPRETKKVFVAHAGDLAKKKALKLVETLREANIPVLESLAKESLKAQLKTADKDKATIAVILGQKEIYEESIIIRDLKSGLQETFPSHRMVEEVKKRLRAD
jgi:histidyl-tRNA synthetase